MTIRFLMPVLLVPAFFLLSMTEPAIAQTDLSWGRIFDESLTPKGIGRLRWMQNGWFSELQQLPEGRRRLVQVELKSGRTDVLITEQELMVEGAPLDVDDYQFSSDGRRVLLAVETEPLWRRSTKSHYYVFDLDSRALVPMLSGVREKVSHAEFAPAGTALVFFRDNNLFLLEKPGGAEIAITRDGRFNHIINGAADWVYEEEFSFSKAWFWSPDARYVAFYRFDESQVKAFSMPKWNTPYPEETVFKYPKAGERNAVVTIGVYDVAAASTTWMDTGAETDQYIVRLNWTETPGKLAIRRMNRLQNRQDLLLADASTGAAKLLKSEENTAWIEENDDLYFLRNGREYLYVSEEDGWNHVYLYKMDGSAPRQLTRGDWEVTQVLGLDEKRNRLFYVRTEADGTQRKLYVLHLARNKTECLTPADGWHTIQMAPDFTFFVDDFTSLEEPRLVQLYTGDGKRVKDLETNAALKQLLPDVRRPRMELIKVPAQDGTPLNAWMIKPVDFDSTRRYPMLMYVYGGPGNQQVQNKFPSGQRPLFHEYLALQGVVVVCVDNRGTGGRGAAFKKQVYRRLGQIEVEDQVAAARYFASKSWIDASRIGIWGWSYGGYMAGLTLARGEGLFKFGISVAPVSDWLFYDTIYTERFMQTPALNPEGYRNGSLLHHASGIKGNYLLIHGTADDNVHWQHAIELAEVLTQQGTPFQMMYYRNRNHGISGGKTREHLHRTMLDFILNQL